MAYDCDKPLNPYDVEPIYDRETTLAMLLEWRPMCKTLILHDGCIEDAVCQAVCSKYSHFEQRWLGPPHRIDLLLSIRHCPEFELSDFPSRIQIPDRNIDWLQWTAKLLNAHVVPDGHCMHASYAIELADF